MHEVTIWQKEWKKLADAGRWLLHDWQKSPEKLAKCMAGTMLALP
jgi:hypothetical protein